LLITFVSRGDEPLVLRFKLVTIDMQELSCKAANLPGHEMPIAKLTVELEIPHAHSLKDRRQVVRSIKDKLRHDFNLSIAELDDGSIWNRATLGIASISSSASYLTGQIQRIDEAVHRLAAGLSAEVVDSYAEILPE